MMMNKLYWKARALQISGCTPLVSTLKSKGTATGTVRLLQISACTPFYYGSAEHVRVKEINER
jgi:hypothetical protein